MRFVFFMGDEPKIGLTEILSTAD
jgi:hypothetical protein